MTCTNTADANGADTDDAPSPEAKAVLFCPRCDYRAQWDGAWRVRTEAGLREVYCPECGARVS